MADYAMQISFRMNEVLINVPILEGDPDLISSEVELKLATVERHAGLIASVQSTLNAAAVVAGLLGAKPVGAAPAALGGFPAPGTAAPQGQAPFCEHGQKTWKAGTSQSSGKPYKGWFCPSNVQGCSPTFVR